MLYFAWALKDAAGNRSAIKTDSMRLANVAPVLVSISDTTIIEDLPWSDTLSAFDINGDSLLYGIVRVPQGFSIDSVRGAMAWTPLNEHVGADTIVVRSTDNKGGMAIDTIIITVVNTNDPPVVSFNGTTSIFEDSLYRGVVVVEDPDKNDSASIAAPLLPQWLRLDSNAITGTPSNDDVGADTIEIIVTDRAGISDTLTQTIEVLNTNDPPQMLSLEIPDTAYERGFMSISGAVTDPDNGDSLTFVWKKQPSWLTLEQFSRVDSVAQWRFVLSGTPSQADTGMKAIGFAIVDMSRGRD
jgi:hypothetical protein